MAFKSVLDLSADVTISLGGFNKKLKKDNPKSVEGYFLGGRQVASPKSKNGLAWLYTLQTSKGNVGVWGKTDMDRKLSGVKPGTMTRITHSGMIPTPNGDMYKYTVETDSDNTIEVSGADVVETTNNDDSDESYVANSYNGTEESVDADDEDAEQAAALAAAERKAKVAALLKKKA